VKPFEGNEEDDYDLLNEEREEEDFEEEPQREILEARVLHDEMPEQEESEEEEEEVELKPVDLDRLDLNNIKVEEGDVMEDSEDEDAIERRRALARAKAKARKQKQSKPSEPVQRVKVKPLKKPVKQEIEDEEEGEDVDDSDSDSESGSTSSSDSSSDEEDGGERRRRPKFTFIAKKKRKDMKLESFADSEDRIQDKEKKKRKDKRKKMIRQELIDYVRTQENADDKSSDEDIPDDDDDVDKDAQFELWKLRELKRMKRTQDLLDERQAEIEETERRRNMTDAEIIAEMKRKPEKSRHRMKFLQKYFHKGAFFVGDDKIVDQKLLNRNLNAAVGTDKWMNFDDTSLPDVLRVKNFGLASRTKYTHLLDQDTTMNRNEDKWDVDPEGYGEIKRSTDYSSGGNWGRPTLAPAGALEPVQYREIGGMGPISRPSKKRKAGFPSEQRKPPQPE